MSRMTSAQVIALGEYLEPEFEPASLTVSQLLGVLGYHNINYPTPYSKTKLVQVFNEEVKSRAAKFRKERLKKENSLASDDGITDGLTGQPIGGPRKVSTTRRSSRRLSQNPVETEELPPVRADPPKRRRSSAQPNLGVPSRQSIAAPPTLAEESEPEEDEIPRRKIGRSKKTLDAPAAHARRTSGPFSEDSGWEDNNIFQSGAESSSPVRPSPVKPKAARKSTAPRKSRKSMSAPPQLLPSSPPRPFILAEKAGQSPPQSRFEPKLPLAVSRETEKISHLFNSPNIRDTKAESSGEGDLWPHEEELSEIAAAAELGALVEAEDELPVVDWSQDEGFEAPVEKRVVPHDPSQVAQALEPTPWPLWLRFIGFVFALATSGVVVNYKLESAAIGFCDRGSTTNRALETVRAHRIAVEDCNRDNRTTLYPIPPSKAGGSGEQGENDALLCPLLPLPLPVPNECTPCPDHATCDGENLVCDNGFLLRSHRILFFLPPPTYPLNPTISASSPIQLVWKTIAGATNGLPGFGSVAFPPRCVEDPKRKRNIGVLGKAVEAMLGQERGRRVCAGGKILDQEFDDREGGEARKWGIELDALRDTMRRKTSTHLLGTFDDTFNEAIQQLIQWGGVIIGEDQGTGTRYLAHKTPDLTWNCALTVKARGIWAEWRSTVLGVVAVILGAFVARARRVQKQIEGRRIAELVQIALDALRNQELAHHTDPITAPHPYLSSLQLRDLVLQDEHSIPVRQRVWSGVEAIVEGNANVRVNLEETSGGDELRVWRWVGGAGRTPGIRKLTQSDGKHGQARGDSN